MKKLFILIGFLISFGSSLVSGQGVTNLFFNKSIENAFTMTINTALGTGTDDFTLPCRNVGTYNAVIYWGDGSQSIITAYNDTDLTHTYATGGTYTVTITGSLPAIYFNNGGDMLKVTGITNYEDLDFVSDQLSAFYGCGNMTTFNAGSSGITFLNETLTSATNMFNNCSFPTFTEGITFAALTTANSFCYQGDLTSLASTITFASLVTASNSFWDNEFTQLPAGMTLNLLSNGSGMFFSTPLSTLGSSVTLPAITNGSNMFWGCTFTTVSNSMSLPNLTNGGNMFNNITLTTENYSQLLVNIEANNSNTGVTFHGGNSQYNTTGQTARNALTSRVPPWTITDGGLE